MFKKNEEYKQYDLFDLTFLLSDKQNNLLSNSIEHSFLVNIFSRINENDFKELYSNKKSRPNVPVNQLVGSLILKHLFNWTYNDLFRNLNFNILTRYAIGINSIEENVFSEATIFNFQNKIINHYVNTGQDLLTEVFDHLTAEQLVEFNIKADIQRGDSFLMGSNIFDYTRLQLLIEVLLRLYRSVEETDKAALIDIIRDYTKQTSGQYIYKIEKENLPKEIEKLANIYHKIHLFLVERYSEKSAFMIFNRVYQEHFVIVENKVEVIPSNELNSSILMSPDDQDATYRYKRSTGNKGSKGFSGHVSETANPKNDFNLITDIAVVPNNVDDAKILETRLPIMVDKTPTLNEYHSDGGYGSPKVDEIMEKESIIQIQNAIRGRKAFASFVIKEREPNEYWVSCEYGQIVKAQKATKGKKAKRHKAVFDYYTCMSCPLSSKCRAKASGEKINRPIRTWYFSKEKIRLHKRQQNINLIPKERKKIRANCEATIKEVKRGVKNGKVRIRGINRAIAYLSLTSIAVNLTRIHKYYEKNHRIICQNNGNHLNIHIIVDFILHNNCSKLIKVKLERFFKPLINNMA